MKIFYHAILGVVLAIALMAPAFAQRTQLKPGGFNMFSAQEDVAMGQQVAQDAEKKIAMLNDRRVDDYLNRLGLKLAAHAPGEKYPYRFKCVNDSEINAFALPGGFLYINRGVIEAADNEAELAGVISHEIGHTALRHGTKQASKSYAAQFPLAILGSVMGNKSTKSLITQLGGGLLANAMLNKYSRDDERAADLMGTQILYDCNYDPRYMMEFFKKLGSDGRSITFFSTHPNPEDRIKNINSEIGRIGPLPGNPANDTREFRSIKQYVKSLAPAPKAASIAGAGESPRNDTGQIQRPPRPSTRLKVYNGERVSLRHPDNWKSYKEEYSFTLAPENGLIGSGDSSALAYGVAMETVEMTAGGWRLSLKQATDQLLANLQRQNADMRVTKSQRQIRVAGKPALSMTLASDSPVGGRETDWLVTVDRPEGLIYFVFVAPEQEFASYQTVFQKILDSVRFK